MLVADVVKRRTRSFRSRNSVAMSVLLSRFAMSVLDVDSSSSLDCNSLFTVCSSSFMDCSSSLDVVSSSFVDCSSSFVDCSSSFVERSSSCDTCISSRAVSSARRDSSRLFSSAVCASSVTVRPLRRLLRDSGFGAGMSVNTMSTECATDAGSSSGSIVTRT